MPKTSAILRDTGFNRTSIVLLVMICCISSGYGQQKKIKSKDEDASKRQASLVPQRFFRNLAFDQRQIWTSPFKARVQDLNWLVPMVGLTAGLINADAELSSRIDTTGTFSRHSTTVANAGLATMVAGGGGLYLLGKIRKDDHEAKTGIIAGEAAVNSLVVAEVLKAITRRDRPADDNGEGKFFKSSSLLNSSFPSLHSVAAWSIASAVAHEYPGPLSQMSWYGLATMVSLARVYGKDHFPSDAFAGAVMGWLIGRQVYRAHPASDYSDELYGTFSSEARGEESPLSQFSEYVTLDSWIYPAMDRLAALGVIRSDIVGLRPWTRAECARLVQEGQARYATGEGKALLNTLAAEFGPELNGRTSQYLSLDSLYARSTTISGPPLTDGYHFGQTIVNDFGRPYQRGENALAGFSVGGSSGNLGFYVRGEYEHAPAAPAPSQALQNAIQLVDHKPPASALPTPVFNQFRLLDSYIALNIKGWQTSFGKQSLWLSPTQDPFLQSTNAEPIYMLRVDQSTPLQLPWIFKYLGPFRTEFWAGKLTGHHFVNTQDGHIAVSIGRTLSRQPMINGVKVNFKMTPNFEFGVGRTGLFGGPDFPITVDSVGHSLFSTTNAVGRGKDPGDRRSTFDFSYRIPGLRNWLTLYDDSFVEDEISPIGYPRRAAHNPGLYLSHIPGLSRLDLRMEAGYTNLPGLIQPHGGGFFYWNVRYLDGYTNDGNIIGDATVGRQGISARAESTYWIAADRTIQLGFRSNVADSSFLQGGNLKDIYLHSEWRLKSKLSLNSFLQYERWNFPLLASTGSQNNFTASFMLVYSPPWGRKH